MRSDEIKVGSMVKHRWYAADFLGKSFGVVLEEPHSDSALAVKRQARVYWLDTNRSTIVHPDHLEEAC